MIEKEDFLTFTVWNNGPAFTKEALESADNLFTQKIKGRSNKHYGIGLSFAQAVAKAPWKTCITKIPQRVERQLVYLLKNSI